MPRGTTPPDRRRRVRADVRPPDCVRSAAACGPRRPRTASPSSESVQAGCRPPAPACPMRRAFPPESPPASPLPPRVGRVTPAVRGAPGPLRLPPSPFRRAAGRRPRRARCGARSRRNRRLHPPLPPRVGRVTPAEQRAGERRCRTGPIRSRPRSCIPASAASRQGHAGRAARRKNADAGQARSGSACVDASDMDAVPTTRARAPAAAGTGR